MILHLIKDLPLIRRPIIICPGLGIDDRDLDLLEDETDLFIRNTIGDQLFGGRRATVLADLRYGSIREPDSVKKVINSLKSYRISRNHIT